VLEHLYSFLEFTLYSLFLSVQCLEMKLPLGVKRSEVCLWENTALNIISKEIYIYIYMKIYVRWQWYLKYLFHIQVYTGRSKDVLRIFAEPLKDPHKRNNKLNFLNLLSAPLNLRSRDKRVSWHLLCYCAHFQ
jgi:hypothetical protein